MINTQVPERIIKLIKQIGVDTTEMTPVKQRTGNEVYHHIETTAQPAYSRPRRLSAEKLRDAKAEFDFMLQQGIIRPSSSPWASPLHLVRKKTGDWRPCGDFRKLNSQTLPDRYPLPNIQDCTISLHNSTIYSTIDLTKAYLQIPVNPDDIPKTAVTTPFGLFEFLRMPFGLRNAAQTFQRYMDSITRDLPFVYVYIDDILVFSQNIEEHYQHLSQIFKRLKECGISINVSKSVFAKEEVTFLGNIISSKGIAPHPDKIAAIESYPKPKTIQELKRFLGTINFYHRFHPKMAEIQAPLHLKAVNNDKSLVEWTNEMDEAFDECKRLLSESTLLSFPDPLAEISVMTDASNVAIGGALHQKRNSQLQPLAFYSRKLSEAEKKYSTYDRELLAVYATIKKFSHLLEGRTFKVYTDHRPLIYAFKKNSDNLSPRQTRHLSYISQFTTDINYVEGFANAPADALSRIYSVVTGTVSPLDLANAQKEDDELKAILSSGKYSLQLRQLNSNDVSLYCDVSTRHIRVYVPAVLRKRVFDQIHTLAHPGGRATSRLIADRFVWPYMQRDIKTWVRQCTDCQLSKVHKHTHSPLSQFLQPDERFAHVHIDIVGPLPSSRGYTYLLTCIDRYTRWLEALPMTCQTAETVASTFFAGWIARFGSPSILVTDQGRNFESSLFRQVSTRLGIEVRHTTSYHPQANGLIERSHRTLKAALMCRLRNATENWANELPIVLLGLRCAYKPDIQATPANLVYGTNLRLPGDFFETKVNTNVNPNLYVQQLAELLNKIRPILGAHLGTCSFIRILKTVHMSMESMESGNPCSSPIVAHIKLSGVLPKHSPYL